MHPKTRSSPQPGRGVFGSLGSPKKSKRAGYIFSSASLAVVLVCVSILVPGAVERLLQDGIRRTIVWLPNSPPSTDEHYRGPADPNDPKALGTVFTVWLWNITNVDEIRAGDKPKLELVGPFKYRRIRRKVDVWWDKEGRVSVKEWSYYLEPFNTSSTSGHMSDGTHAPQAGQEEAPGHGSSSQHSSSHHRVLSGAPAARAGISLDQSSRWHAQHDGQPQPHHPQQDQDGPMPDLDAPIVTLNLPLIGVIEVIHGNVGPAAARLLDLMVAVLAGHKDEHVNGLFIKRTARELIWGYEDPLLSALASVLPAGSVPRTFVSLVHNMTGPEQALATKPSVYDTGRDNINNVWTLLQDNGVTHVTSWPQLEGCPAAGERVWGTDAFQFAPGVRCHTPRRLNRTILHIWVTDLYRGGSIMCAGKEWLYGIKLLRFMPDPAQAAQPDPCHDERIAGLMNITRPTAAGPNGNGTNAHGTPLYLSMPHFCGSDPSLREGVDGLAECGQGEGWDAVPLQFATYLDIEPITGIPMRAAKRVQLSSEMGRMARKHLEPRINVSTIYPILIGSEEVSICVEQANVFKGSVYWALRVKAHLRIWPLLFGVIASTACIALLVAEASHREASWRAHEHTREEEARQMIEAAESQRRRDVRQAQAQAQAQDAAHEQLELEQPLLQAVAAAASVPDAEETPPGQIQPSVGS